jgi:hypothetical protein
MAGTKAWKPGLSSERRMRQAAVKSELEVIADPKGTAVNAALLLHSPSAVHASRVDRVELTEASPLMWSQPTLKEIGDGERSTKVPAFPERRVPL